ncbi:hypothetical protein PoB_002707000 [Plakobranchus ocellatus]|uniref:Uncharacterized protein n=1 Tax=Plakobranchus ocellatus TaxID=259542 RepID=A0AAV3ZXG8_9GAST|nr:hypothetical protein PoB_002707000 [Plakobranchus ocellatus]
MDGYGKGVICIWEDGWTRERSDMYMGIDDTGKERYVWGDRWTWERSDMYMGIDDTGKERKQILPVKCWQTPRLNILGGLWTVE